MICENWDPFKKNEREALIKKMVLKRLGDEIRTISYQKFVFSMNLWFSAIIFRKPRGTKLQEIILGKIRSGGIEHFKKLQKSWKYCWKSRFKKKYLGSPEMIFRKSRGTKLQEIILGKIRIGGIEHFKKLQNSGKLLLKNPRLKKKYLGFSAIIFRKWKKPGTHTHQKIEAKFWQKSWFCTYWLKTLWLRRKY